MASGRLNKFINTWGPAIAFISAAILIFKVLVAPANECAADARKTANEAKDATAKLTERVAVVETRTENINPNLVRLMHTYGVPTVTEVPPGAFPGDMTVPGDDKTK